MTEDGAMERGRLDGVSPYHLPANRFLGRATLGGALFCRFFAAPVLQHSMSEWRIVILRPSRKFHTCGASAVLLWWK
jgi:hypothetical protein